MERTRQRKRRWRFYETATAGGLLENFSITPARAARVLGIDRQEVAGLLHGRFGEYSQAQLRRFIKALDQEGQAVR
jgi:predicted XRE-type DNA-binding protein